MLIPHRLMILANIREFWSILEDEMGYGCRKWSGLRDVVLSVLEYGE
jgi:hypothetical protein